MTADRDVCGDPSRLARLDDDGLPGYAAAVGITADGEEILALVHVGSTGTDTPVARDWRTVAPHEMPGRLPARWARDHGLLICGRRAVTSGKPCRNTVRNVGDSCAWHQDQEAK